MPWNPEIYNQFKSIRNRPFFDLMEFISEENLKNGLDIGCGTGAQTQILSERFEKANFLGIDPSPEMLEKAKEIDRDNLEFKNSTIENFLISIQKTGIWFFPMQLCNGRIITTICFQKSSI